MKKIFIGCPFIKFIEHSEFTDKRFRKFIEDLYDICSKYAQNVFLALKREEFGKKRIKKYSCLMDLQEAENCDLAVIVPDDSMGVAVEIGWLSAMKKPIILILSKKKDYTPLVFNIDKITPCIKIFYDDKEEECLDKVKEIVACCEGNKNGKNFIY